MTPPFPTAEGLPPRTGGGGGGGLCQQKGVFSAGKRDEGDTGCRQGRAVQ